MEELAAEEYSSVNAVLERAVERLLEYGEARPLTVKLYHTAPCGEWQDANDADATDFELSPDLVNLWGVHPTDHLIHTRGASMCEEGIPDEAILHIRPFGFRAPRSGQICVVTAVNRETNESWGTVKKWMHDGQKAVLKDGKGDTLEMPEGANEVHAVGYWTGNVIGVSSG
jgi:SOS-response transcriptional repressor LexA